MNRRYVDVDLIRVYVEAVGPGRYTARRDAPAGQVLVPNSSSPMYAAAHALDEINVDPDTLLTMRHVGKEFDSFHPLPLWRWLEFAAGRTKGGERDPQPE